MGKSLKILFMPLDAIGHVNACIGIAEVLKASGHQIIFIINDAWTGKLEKYGFIEEVITEENRDPNIDVAKHWANMFVMGIDMKTSTPLEKTLYVWNQLVPKFVESTKNVDPIYEKLIARIRPDVIILDQVLCVPSVETCGIPYVRSCSFDPLMFIRDERTPPVGSGFPSNSNKDEWKKFSNVRKESNNEIWKNFNDWVISRGAQPVTLEFYSNDSPFANIYGYPLELDYLDVRPLPPNWYRFDNLKRTEKLESFEIPECLKHESGKLIYLSMGSMGGADIELMNTLISILSKSKHRYIVSKGPLHNQIQLSKNMWGQQSVPQIKVLPIVDLVITHGGNNTVTETFYFGKPMIVIPLFSDQYDNAQRIDEKGFGIRIDPNQITEQKLLGSIEKLLNDTKLREDLSKISQRIQSENSISKLPEIIEKLVKS